MSKPATVTSSVTTERSGLAPECVHNLLDAVNAITRVAKHTCEGLDRFVVSVDELSTEVLSQQVQIAKAQLAKSREAKSLPAA